MPYKQRTDVTEGNTESCLILYWEKIKMVVVVGGSFTCSLFSDVLKFCPYCLRILKNGELALIFKSM